MVKNFYTVGDKFLNDAIWGTPTEYVLVSAEYNKFNLISTSDWRRVFSSPIIGEHGQVSYDAMAERLGDHFIGVGDTIYPVKEPIITWADLGIGDFFITVSPKTHYTQERVKVKTGSNSFKTMVQSACELSLPVVFSTFEKTNSPFTIKRVTVDYSFAFEKN